MHADLDNLFDPHGAWIAPVPGWTPPSTSQAWHDWVLAIAQGIGQLPADTRQVLLMRERQGCTVDEIAGRLGLPVETIADLLLWARFELQHGLRQPCPVARA